MREEREGEINDIYSFLIYKDDEENYENNNKPIPVFTGDKKDDKLTLYNMNFDPDLINTIYNNINPININEAIDYFIKNEQGQFIHSYIPNERFVCSICGKGRNAHESEAVFLDDNNNIIQTPNNDIIQTPNNNINNNINDNNINNNNNNNDNNLITNPLNKTIHDNYDSEFDDIIDNILRRSNPRRNDIYESSYKNSKLNEYKTTQTCGICFEKINYPESSIVKLRCLHYFCKNCWFEYLKEKINNANVAKISCMQNGCNIILDDYFINKIINQDEELIKKYKKFSEKKRLLQSNKDIKFCPFPDCDGYAEKKNNDKYVKCNFGHEFCFICLNKPHGNRKCSEILDKEFDEWKSHKIVKRCPKCKIWTEKNEGCNHMTCVECNFQWCWLCQKEYKIGHYDSGSCRGLQFEKEQDEEKIKQMLENNLKNENNNISNNYNYNYNRNNNYNYNYNRNNNRYNDLYNEPIVFYNDRGCCRRCCCFCLVLPFLPFKYLFKFLYFLLRFTIWFFILLFLAPYIIMFRNIFIYGKKDYNVYFMFILFFPFFICYQLISMAGIFIIIGISVIIPPFNEFLGNQRNDYLEELPFELNFLKERPKMCNKKKRRLP